MMTMMMMIQQKQMMMVVMKMVMKMMMMMTTLQKPRMMMTVMKITPLKKMMMTTRMMTVMRRMRLLRNQNQLSLKMWPLLHQPHHHHPPHHHHLNPHPEFVHSSLLIPLMTWTCILTAAMMRFPSPLELRLCTNVRKAGSPQENPGVSESVEKTADST